MKIEWSSLSPEEFEHFCVELVDLLDLRNINWRKSGADGGADITAEYVLKFPEINKQRKEFWVIQCKKHKRSISLSENLRTTLDFAKENEAQCILFVTTSHFTLKAKRWFGLIEKDEKIRVLYLENFDLERLVFNHPERFSLFFEEKKSTHSISQLKIGDLKPAIRILSILVKEIGEIKEKRLEITFAKAQEKCKKYGFSKKEVLFGLYEAEREELLQSTYSNKNMKIFILDISIFNAIRQFNDLLSWGDP